MDREEDFNGFGFWDCLFALICFYDGLPEDKMEGRPSRKAGDKQADKQRAIVAAAVDDQLERINELKERATEREDLAGDAEARSFSLPPVDATDKLLRSPRQATLSRHGPAGASATTAEREKRCRLPSTSIWEEGGTFLPNKAKKFFVFNRGEHDRSISSTNCWSAPTPDWVQKKLALAWRLVSRNARRAHLG